MHTWFRVFSATVATAALLGSSVVAASAQELRNDDGGQAVFVQGNDPAGNQVLAYHRDRSGALTLAARYPTGGNGGRIQGSAVDPLASQNSLIFDSAHHLLIGVNAGSDSIYAFELEDGGRLGERQVLGSDGSFPVSVAVNDDLVYVLNAGGAGSVHGYRIEGGHLRSIDGSTRSLGLTPVTGPTAFLNSPGQVGFTPDGRQLVVTTKANGNHIDVFNVRDDGRLSDTPVVNPSATPVPFAFTFDGQRRLVVGEAAASSVSTYQVHADGTLTTIGSQPDSQAALCWIDRDGQTFFAANAGSGSVSAFRLDASGHPILVGTTPVGPGAIDLHHARGGQFLYVLLGGNHTVGEFRVNADGSLTSVGNIAGSVTEEGIVAL